MLEQIIIGLLVVIIAMMIYFNINNQDDKEDFNIQSIKDVQVELKDKIVERDTLDLKSIEDFKNHLNSKKSDEKIIMIGDFGNRLSPDVRLVLDTVFYHNPYMNRMWSTIKVYSN